MRHKTSGIKHSNKWPKWLRESAITEKKTICKAFSSIGIEDSESEVKIAGSYVGGYLRIVFSTKPWDIATMSMRGISSCQRWRKNGAKHSKKLIGSIVDPYVGIIYLTDGVKTDKGERMLARSVVRITAGWGSYRPYIMLEKVYSMTVMSTSAHEQVSNAFKSFLHEKCSLPISYQGGGLFIPLSEAVRKLPENKRSYRDSGLVYKPLPDFRKRLTEISTSTKIVDKEKTNSQEALAGH
jgi:hypothetical protein